MKPEIEALQGTWTVVSLEMDGQPMDGGADARVVVENDRFTTSGMGAVYEGRVEIDAARKPKHFTLVFTAGPEKGNSNPGIYELDGDTWRLCLNTRGGKRPAKFATTPGSGLALETLKRGGKAAASAEKPAKARASAPVAPPEGDPAPELAGVWKMAAMVFNGNPLEAAYLPFGTREATAMEVKVMMSRQVILEASYRVDRSSVPHHMNYTLARGPHKGKAQLGIWRLDGDTLETCFAAPGGQRPTEFASAAGDGRTHTVWKHDKK